MQTTDRLIVKHALANVLVGIYNYMQLLSFIKEDPLLK